MSKDDALLVDIAMTDGPTYGEEFGRASSNALWLITDKVVRVLAGTLITLWMAHYLGPGVFGVYAYVLAWVALFGEFARLALDYIVVKDLVERPGAREQILSTAFWLRAGGGVVAAISVMLCASAFGSVSRDVIALIGIASLALFFQCLDSFDYHFQARIQSKLSAVLSGLVFIAFCIVKAALILTQADLEWFIWAGSLETLSLGIVLVLRYVHQCGSLPLRAFDPGLAVSMVRSVWPLILSSLAIMLFMRVDQFLLNWYQGEAALGVYAIALRISEASYFLPMAVVASVSPLIVRAKQQSDELYRFRLQQLLGVLGVVGLCSAVSILLIGSILLSLLGEAYSGAIPILAVHVWTAVFIFLGVGQSPWIINEGRQMFSLQRGLIGVFAKVSLCLLLLPKMGPVGAAAACVLSAACAYVFSNVMYADSRPVMIMQIRSLRAFGACRRLLMTHLRARPSSSATVT